MVFECELDNFHFVLKILCDPAYLPEANHSPHSNKELRKLQKGKLHSFQIFVDVRTGEDQFQVFFPTVLLPPKDSKDFMQVLEDDFFDHLVHHITEYWEKCTKKIL